jgi:Cdc6-like AAA superfamily ATPase
LLKELGFLSNGEIVLKTASDFVGGAVGESQNKTSQILESARGKVLIIDEAYALDDSLYGKQVLNTLVEKVQGGPADDMAVLLLGYEEPMLTMLRNQNPGLARRFPKDQAFYFDDYDENELLAILKCNIKANDVEATLEFREKAIDVLRTQKSQAHFGNAAAVQLVLKSAMQKAAERLGPNTKSIVLDHIDIDDPGSARSNKDGDPLALLDKLYRMEKVKEKLQRMSMAWSISRRDGDENPKLGHFVFTGSPGKVILFFIICHVCLKLCLP